MIYNRTAEDVNEAKKIIDEKVKKFLSLTNNEIEILSRGAFTVSDINRILSKQEEIKKAINSIGYYDTNLIINEYSNSSVFYKEDFEKIISNNEILRKSFFDFLNSPQKAKPVYHYEELNKIEKLLNDLELIFNDVISRFKRCGTFNCGG